jgi:hypothetical protein
MTIYEQASNAGIPIFGTGMRGHVPHGTPPGRGYSHRFAGRTADRWRAYRKLFG